MKKSHLLAVISLLLAGCMASYFAGRQSRQKDYEAACILSDICRYQLDYHDEDGEFEELYYDVLDNLDCYGTSVTREEVHTNYHWCY